MSQHVLLWFVQRTFEVGAEEEDTPTKRAKVCRDRFAQQISRTFELHNPLIEKPVGTE